MNHQTIIATPLSPVIGAEISGINLTLPLVSSQIETLKQALADHLVLFFREQDLDFESHKRMAP